MFRIRPSQESGESDRHGKVLYFDDGQYRRADEDQELDSRDLDDAERTHQEALMKKNKDYLTIKHLNSKNEYEYEERIRNKQITVRNRDTQTPVREGVSEGMQFEGESVEESKSKFGPRSIHGKSMAEDKSMKSPISTIDK